jgi:glycerol-3-phosphate cytidylyltransferase-like family protein
MSTIVIMPGGFHPFHAGHMALYNSARQAFPDADLYVAATNSQEERPFPFAVKEKLAKVAGVEPGHFVQVKSPFQAKEITQNYNPDEDILIFVRSEKDKNESPKPGGTKKDGTPSYFQPYTGKNMQPFSQHAYFAYLPTVKFGPGITSATEIRNAWPTLNDKRKTAMVMSLYPASQKNPKLAANIVGMLDQVMGVQENVVEEGYGNHPSQRVDPRTGKKYVPPKSPLWQGVAEENGGVGGGFGTNYPGTYEQENGPFTHKGGLKLTSLTTESVDYLDEK